MAQCLTDGAVYTVKITPRTAMAQVKMPATVTLVDEEEIRERIHRGMEWALAPYFVGKFENNG